MRARPAPVALPRTAKVWWATGGLFVTSIIVVVVIMILPSSYVIEAPGATVQTTGRVTVPADVKTYDHKGGFHFVTASETTDPSYFQAVVGWLAPNSDVFPRELIIGNASNAEERRFSAVLMSNSKTSAVYQALAELGLPGLQDGRRGVRVVGGRRLARQWACSPAATPSPRSARPPSPTRPISSATWPRRPRSAGRSRSPSTGSASRTRRSSTSRSGRPTMTGSRCPTWASTWRPDPCTTCRSTSASTPATSVGPPRAWR